MGNQAYYPYAELYRVLILLHQIHSLLQKHAYLYTYPFLVLMRKAHLSSDENATVVTRVSRMLAYKKEADLLQATPTT